jgi:phosphoglycolate phosphatase
LEEYFRAFSCSGESEPKPSANGLESLDIRTPKSEIIMIGDSTGDMRGAKEYGCIAVGALWCGYNSRDQLTQAGADYCFEHPLKLKEWIKGKI